MYYIFFKSTLGYTRIDAHSRKDLKEKVAFYRAKGFTKFTIYNELGLRVPLFLVSR